MSDLHPFQKRGLGFAPFRFVRLAREPGGCAYCGTPLAWSCHVADVDGREFVVGTDCVQKTCGGGALYDEAMRELKRQQKVARAAAKQAKLVDLGRRREAAQNALAADPKLLADVPYIPAYTNKVCGSMRSQVEYLLRAYLISDRGIKQVQEGCKAVEAALGA